MITGLPPLQRYLSDKQWLAVSKAIREAGGKSSESNRLHVDAVLDLMRTNMPWRDLDYRYGPWSQIHSKIVRWFETGVLHGIVVTLFKLGMTTEWKSSYIEFSSGPSAVKGPKIRPLMAEIANQLKRQAETVKKKPVKVSIKLPNPEKSLHRLENKERQKKIKAAVKARRGLVNGKLSSEDWNCVISAVPSLAMETQTNVKSLIEELIDVMRTNKAWCYMDTKVGKWSEAHSKFTRWQSDGTMRRLVKSLHELGLTAGWNTHLVAPLVEGERSLKLMIGAEAYNAAHSKKRKRATSSDPKANDKNGKRADAKTQTPRSKSEAAINKPKDNAAVITAESRKRTKIKTKNVSSKPKKRASRSITVTLKPGKQSPQNRQRAA